MISRLYFALQEQQYKNGGEDDHWRSASAPPSAPSASPSVLRVFHCQPCRPCRESSTLSIDSQLASTTVSLRLCKDQHRKMGKCYGGEFGCDGRSRNIKSWCGMCTRAKRARGEKVVNKGSPYDADLSQAIKKRPHDRLAYEQGLCDRYALRCMSQCTQCWLQCICSNMRRADSRICGCTRSVILCVIIRANKHNQTGHKAVTEALHKLKAGVFLTDKESRGIDRYSHASPALPRLHMY